MTSLIFPLSLFVPDLHCFSSFYWTFTRCAPAVFPNVIQGVKQYHCLYSVWIKRGVEAPPVKMSEWQGTTGGWVKCDLTKKEQKLKRNRLIRSFFSFLHPDSCRRRSRKSSVCLKSVCPPTHRCLPSRCWPTSRLVAACRFEQNLNSNLRLESHPY